MHSFGIAILILERSEINTDCGFHEENIQYTHVGSVPQSFQPSLANFPLFDVYLPQTETGIPSIEEAGCNAFYYFRDSENQSSLNIMLENQTLKIVRNINGKTMKLYNALGQLVKSNELNQKSNVIMMDALLLAVYFCEILNSKGIQIKQQKIAI